MVCYFRSKHKIIFSVLCLPNGFTKNNNRISFTAGLRLLILIKTILIINNIWLSISTTVCIRTPHYTNHTKLTEITKKSINSNYLSICFSHADFGLTIAVRRHVKVNILINSEADQPVATRQCCILTTLRDCNVNNRQCAVTYTRLQRVPIRDIWLRLRPPCLYGLACDVSVFTITSLLMARVSNTLANQCQSLHVIICNHKYIYAVTKG